MDVFDSYLCCGLVGIYVLMYFDLVRQLWDNKMNVLESGKLEMIVIVNIGCQMYLVSVGCIFVCYWIEIVE